MMRRAKIVGTILGSLALAISQQGFGNAADNNGNSNGRPLNVGNYIQLEPGSSPVVIRAPRPEGINPSPVMGGLYTSLTTDTTPITYAIGAPVLTKPKLYIVWYGSWNSLSATSPVPVAKDYAGFTHKLISGLAASNRWNNIIKNYYMRTNATDTATVQNLTDTVTSVIMPASSGTYGNIIKESAVLAIATKAFPTVDPQGIYMVITSSDVPVSGFNSGQVQFCGYHGYGTSVPGTTKRVYGFVGDAAAQPRCIAQSISPSGNAGADSTASVLIHEIEEATTDPQLNAWWASTTTKYENADKCAWTWETASEPLLGSSAAGYYNSFWNSTNYLIQMEFKLTTRAPSVTGKDVWNGVCAVGR